MVSGTEMNWLIFSFFFVVCYCSDRSALVDLFIQTGGYQWTDNFTLWNTDAPVCSWNHVVCNQKGRVQELKLSAINMIGKLTGSIEELTELNFLDLSLNELSGELPRELGKLKLLEHLLLGSNNFEGTVPEEIWKMSSLRELDLSYNFFSGEIPDAISSLIKLVNLTLSSNSFDQAIPSGLSNLKYLQNLYLDYNNFTDPVPDLSLSNLTLTYFDLSFNSFNANSPPIWMKNLHSLIYLGLSGNDYSYIPNEWEGSMLLLEMVYLDSNALTILPSFLRYLSNLEELVISNNLISGDIPLYIGELRRLNYLDLSFNQFQSASFSKPLWAEGYICLAASNAFVCPISTWLIDAGATCIESTTSFHFVLILSVVGLIVVLALIYFVYATIQYRRDLHRDLSMSVQNNDDEIGDHNERYQSMQ